MSKRKFLKLLDKEVKYTANYEYFCPDKNRILLTDVKSDNKIYADHAWIRTHESTKKLKDNTKISFLGTAYMYNDKFDVRKQGLKYCKNFQELSDDFGAQIQKEKNDAKQCKQRTGYKRKYK